MAQTSEIATWWGRHRVPVDRVDIWSVGPLDIMVEHHENFWQIHWRHVGHAASTTKVPNSRSMGVSPDEARSFLESKQLPSATSPHFPAKIHSITIPASNPNEDLIFSPALPEESLIFSLGSAAVLDPSESLQIGFLVPLFIRIETASGQSVPREACEIPLLPLVRTWGGTKPLSGELALAPHNPVRVDRWSEIRPRLDVANLAVTVVNRGSDSLFVDRLAVPCAKLALYHSPQTGFWCEKLVLHAEAGFEGLTDNAGVANDRQERGLPREAGATTLVSHARQTPSESAAMKGLASFRSTIGTSVENLFKERG